ncbi:unnamed protein product, partial [Prunus brigantina]
MGVELQALAQQNTWSLVPLLSGKCVIGSRGVYPIKYNYDGSIEGYKARLIAKGFTQREILDCTETFAPIVKLVTIHCLLALTSVHQWLTYEMDVNNFFLHGDLHEEVYMTPPSGLCQQGESNLVCRLHKSFMLGLHNLFQITCATSFTIALIYVDDMVITDNDESAI